MTFDQFLLILMGPLSVLAVALVIIPLTRWQDQWEARKRAAKEAASHRQ
jgi:hypothetical protein